MWQASSLAYRRTQCSHASKVSHICRPNPNVTTTPLLTSRVSLCAHPHPQHQPAIHPLIATVSLCQDAAQHVVVRHHFDRAAPPLLARIPSSGAQVLRYDTTPKPLRPLARLKSTSHRLCCSVLPANDPQHTFAMLLREGQRALSPSTTLHKSSLPTAHASSARPGFAMETTHDTRISFSQQIRIQDLPGGMSSTVKGIMIGIFSVLGAAGFVLLLAAIVYYFRYTQQGRIFLDRITRPGEFDDEQQFAKEEAEALEEMDDIQRTEYLRAKGMV